MKMLFSMSAINISRYEELVIPAIPIGILEVCYAMAWICVSAFLHLSTSDNSY